MDNQYTLVVMEENPSLSPHNLPYGNYPTWIVTRILRRAFRKENGCLEYGAGELAHKYGLISITLAGRQMIVPAHRAVWMATHRDFSLPSGTPVRHRCGNTRCVDIEHLFTLAPASKSVSGIRKKRQVQMRTRVFTGEEIEFMRTAPGKLKHVAQRFGASPGYISKLRNGKAKRIA